jgi:hypothetical protein
VDYWPLHEASGDRGSSTGLHTLVDSNTVTQNPGIQVYAGQFTRANSESLSVVSDTALQRGDIDWTLACWVYFDALGASSFMIIAKDTTTGSQREFRFAWNPTPNRLQFGCYRSGPTVDLVSADTLGVPSTATWYHMVMWHDSVGNTVNIVAINGGVDSAATCGAMITSTAPLAFGFTNIGATYLDGRLCEVGMWNRLLTAGERYWLYNYGRGRTYPFDGRFSPAMLGRHPALVGPRRTREVGLLAA